jgi:hypothetical protein
MMQGNADPRPQPGEQAEPNMPLPPVFQSEGISQPWMNTATPADPAARVTQALISAQQPPARPANLAMATPQADLPAPSAVPAVGQMPAAVPQAAPRMPDLTSMDSGGAREFAVAEGQRRLGQPSGDAVTSITQALASRGIAPPAAPPTSDAVAKVASALPRDAATGQPASPAVQAVAEVQRAAAYGANTSDPRFAAGIALIRRGDRAAGMALIGELIKPVQYAFTTTPDGTVLRQNPRTGAVDTAYKAPEKATYGVIGKDEFGNERYGWIDPNNRSVTPPPKQAPAAGDQTSKIPPVPPGYDPKVWREQYTKRGTEESMPAGFDDTSKVRNEVAQRPAYKNIAQAAPIYRAMTEAAGRDTKAADLNMVYGLGKIMDPTSVVREGEIQMANDTQGMADRLNGFIRSIQGEGRLRPESRAAIMQEAHGRMQSYAGLYQQDADFYRGIASKNRMDPDQVIPNFGKFDPWTPPEKPAPGQSAPAVSTLPKAGTVEGGYRFKGGNPADPAAWEKSQ